jgi:membrane protease YdiL (CAAX protease family)
MEKRYNLWSFYLIIVCLGLTTYSLYSNIENNWLIAPPNYILLFVSVIVFILGIKGFKDKRNWQAKTRGWLAVILSLLLSTVLTLTILLSLFASSLGANEHIETVHSPDGNYTIDFYRFDAGAAGSFGVRGELNGPLWVKKRIYYQNRVEEVEVEWENNTTISISNHILNLEDGDTFGY